MLVRNQQLVQAQVQAEAEPKTRSTSTSGKKKKISLGDDFVIEGQLDKPSAFFIFRRSVMDYDWPRRRVEFSPLVVQAARDPAF